MYKVANIWYLNMYVNYFGNDPNVLLIPLLDQ